MSHVNIGPTVRVHKMRECLHVHLLWEGVDVTLTGDPERNQNLLTF